jgi:hypothetical protein
MRLQSRMKWIVACAVLGYAASPAGAQTPPPPPGTPPGQSSDIAFQQGVALTPQQQIAQSDGFVKHAGQAHDTVQRRLAQARQQRDVVKVLCLNDKLNQIDVARNALTERHKALQAALAGALNGSGQGDRELGHHELNISTVLHQRVGQLITEANQCIGLEADFAGTTTTYTSVEPQPPDSNTGFGPVGGTPQPPPIEVGPPHPATPDK